MDVKYRVFVGCLLFICIGTVSYISQLNSMDKNYDDRFKYLPMMLGKNITRSPLNVISNSVVRKQFKQSVENKVKSLVENKVKSLVENKFSNLTCSAKKVNASSVTLPITGLVSFPGSGNTWTRHLIQQMSGLGTSSCYCDGDLRMKGFPFECHQDKSKTLVVKTHDYHLVEQYKFKKIVLLIRNPYDALLAYANFAKAGHTGRPSKTVLIQASNKMFNHSIQWYLNLTNSTIQSFRGPVHILQYEKLKTDMSDTLQKLASFLNVNITQRDIDCTVTLQEGNFHRKVPEAEHLQLLKEAYDKDKLLRMREAAYNTAKLLKDAYGLDLDVGSPVERLLFDGTT